MISGSLGLLLSDLRSCTADSVDAIDYCPEIKIGGEYNGRKVNLKELLLTLKLWNSLKKLHRYILPELELPLTVEIQKSSATEAGKGKIDWPETFRRRFAGEKGAVVKNIKKRVNCHHATLVAFILEEVVLHVDFLCSLPISNSRHLRQTFHDIRKWRVAVQKTLNDAYYSYTTEVSGRLGEVKKLYVDSLRNAESLDFTEYYNSLESIFATDSDKTVTLSALVNWRKTYLLGSVWLTDKVGLTFSTDVQLSALYEFWCFAQLTEAFQRIDRGDVIQRSFISKGRSRPEFVLGSNHYAYYDYRNNIYKTAKEEEVFATTPALTSMVSSLHVEWFIRSRLRYEDSVILDTKFRDWSSECVLQVLGYMLNFGVKRGVVIFSGKIPHNVPGAHKIEDGYFTATSQRGDVLWIVNLPPTSEFEERNNRILESVGLDITAAR